ncbi:helix-turn-helix transcriptional regulator [Nocardioides guangzhouensis]|uniref:Helix-turn-helix transcriptional regulator n=1 Tax=Nocardioides guangzhouensis TaxID=2497878 RepID=A0A4Q4Z9Y8_9ACTN|nr:LuxR family transcriptional regulator [Nocardioides guangzhouensis]RYP83894.1 helix-turn-helix transcriptional regulator [Nocardioides guangzhouensis]
MSSLVGRGTLLDGVRRSLAAGRAVVLHGAPGAGRSAVLDELETAAASAGTTVLRVGGAASEQGLAWAALQDFWDQAPAELVAALPSGDAALREGLVGAPTDEETGHRVGRAWLHLLEGMADAGPVLVLIDDAHWVDEPSVRAVVYAGRRLVDRVGFVAAVGDEVPEMPGLARVDPIEVGPLAATDLVALLTTHGLTPAVAQRVAAESGGVPSLALALAGALGEHPSVQGRPRPTPPSIARMLRERLSTQPDDVRTTLLHAALLLRPTTRLLVRAGLDDAEAHLRQATRAGLVVVDDEAVRFTPAALAQVAAEAVPAAERAATHRRLAVAAPSTNERLRHEALAAPGPDAELAGRLADGAGDALRRGARELAAELFLLAADHGPAELHAERTEWLACAIEAGAPGNHADLVYRAMDDFDFADAEPGQRVRVRLALVELAGTGRSAIDEVLTAALADAGDDPLLVANVLLQRARLHLMESRPLEVERNVVEAVRIIRRTGDEEAEAMALPLLAVTRRWTGAGDHDEVLARAVALPQPPTPGLVHTTPRYMAARFALYDDRLDEAWSRFLALLAQVESGAGQDTVHVLRCLVEVGVRLGRCREALEYAARAARVAERFDLDPQASWFISAVAELAGGDLERARTLAAQGVAVCDERGDIRYLQRHLLVQGQVLLRLGAAGDAVAALTRVRAIERENGISDPTVNRWQAELVTALVATGDLDEAAAVAAEAHARLDGRPGAEGTRAQLLRAEAGLHTARGDLDRADVLLDEAAATFERLGMRVDLGRALLGRGYVERRRRRVAAAREAHLAAYTLFREIHAEPWAAQAQRALEPARAEPAVGDDPAALLTDTEARVAREVADGASNREIAERLYLSVKTVEATLTRIYRKLEVRSRTQLARRMVPRG